jgi:hypothetical protein
MGVTAGLFLASILLKEMRYLVYIRYLYDLHPLETQNRRQNCWCESGFIADFKWQYIVLFSHLKELLRLYIIFFYRFFISYFYKYFD